MRALNTRAAAPLKRAGGKGRNAMRLIQHFPKAQAWVEPFFGSGAVFFQLPRGVYKQFLVNDLHSGLSTFFRVLRDRPSELVRVCSLSPYAQDDYRLALEDSDDELESARRMWVRSRYSFGGIDPTVVGNWARCAPGPTPWVSDGAAASVEHFDRYAQQLAGVHVANEDAVKFIRYYALNEHSFIYADPPYVATARAGAVYKHEMSDEQHRELIAALNEAVAAGAKVAVSGYPSALYDELLSSWRRVEIDVSMSMRLKEVGHTERRTEVLWMSYPASEEIGATLIAPEAKPKTAAEKLLVKQARHRR